MTATAKTRAFFHAVDLEQCAVFVDSAPLKKSMTEAAAFLRSIGEPKAWMRRWAFDGVDVMAMPKKDRPVAWQFHAITAIKVAPDDVPLYHLPEATT